MLRASHERKPNKHIPDSQLAGAPCRALRVVYHRLPHARPRMDKVAVAAGICVAELQDGDPAAGVPGRLGITLELPRQPGRLSPLLPGPDRPRRSAPYHHPAPAARDGWSECGCGLALAPARIGHPFHLRHIRQRVLCSPGQ